MIRLDVRSDIKDFRKQLTSLQKQQLPFAVSLAVNRTAEAVKEQNVVNMKRVFDRPTRFTLNAQAIRRGNKRAPEAELFFRDFAPKGTPAGKYLIPQVEGGYRRAKRHEVALRRIGVLRDDEYTAPAPGARLNAFGNIPASRYTAILAQLQAFGEQGYLANETARSRARNRGRARYFTPQFGSRLPRGVWERTTRGTIKPVLWFIKAPRYQRRFRFQDLSSYEARRRFPRIMRKAMEYAVKTATKKPRRLRRAR